ncbi:MAG: cob(I)yrinic acid a,c-diamide adenosyltransferase [Candidatus Margulisiibacteriota bacterium]
MIYVFFGKGGGKTIAALGLALRARGQGKKVAVVQFLKGQKDTGEFKIAKKLGYRIFQFGRSQLIDLAHPQPIDFKLALQGWEKAKQIKADLLILDEINLAVCAGLLPEKEVLSFLKKNPPRRDIVLTGRNVPDSFVKIADGVSEIVKIKHVFDRGIAAKRGIEY